MMELIPQQRERFDYVIVDCPPVLGLADTLAMAPFVDAVLMVARAEKSKRSALVHAVDQLYQVGADVVGGVLNDVPISRRTMRYGYGYGYGFREEPDARATSTPSGRARTRTKFQGTDGIGSAPSAPLDDESSTVGWWSAGRSARNVTRSRPGSSLSSARRADISPSSTASNHGERFRPGVGDAHRTRHRSPGER
jgi:hypothetical protein